MRRIVLVCCLVTVLLLLPVSASAADINFNVNLIRHDDGSAWGEFWYNGRVVWRVSILAGGLEPAYASGTPSGTTIVIPDIVNGWFVLTVR